MTYRKLKAISASVLLVTAFLLVDPLFVYAAKEKPLTNNHSPQTIKLQAQTAVPSKTNVVLHGQIDMLSYACKEVGIALSVVNLPATVKNVTVGSPAYYANVKAQDKIVAANFKDNKFCICLSRGGTPYYTEIRLSSPAIAPPVTANSASNSKARPEMMAIGFRFVPVTGEVTYVDPNSDLFGKVRMGDIFVSVAESINGTTNASAVVYPVFKHNGVLHYYPCRKKPTDSFAREMAEIFRQEGFGTFYLPPQKLPKH